MTKNQFVKFKKIAGAPLLEQKLNKKKILLVVLPLAFSSVLQIYASNSVAGEGYALKQTEAQIEQVKRDNKILREEIAASTSLTKLEAESQGLGLAKPERIVYVKTDSAIGRATGNTAYVGTQVRP
ncbi:MAG: hypothetical protein A2782_00240 [Candidatus Blackburnbacteria bacterium RIFCSPHIGHO2_01_FULL_43_15b]|uniref:Cell division protein FtsL n=1 Tax=Candidatus Blackburnbacteria bacterium RIFCSPHIGHO2_01_FULL_43_15b TaxID=1797513 RepID=A0A1G1V1N6_9BACT|nr:MAG: hypothetical protein A2782_00240 [Candidatus Blackburnbacteria bacterium RIFCSPHIGHO2_01_FULL_43_15b]